MKGRPLTAAWAVALAVGLSAAGPPAAAQAHVKNSGEYRIRASTTSAANLPLAMRQKHDIPSDPGTAVLNVTVLRNDAGTFHNVAAKLDVDVHDLLGARSTVDMREVVGDQRISYLGVYRLLPRAVLDFRITAQPEGTERTITLEFRDRLGRR